MPWSTASAGGDSRGRGRRRASRTGVRAEPPGRARWRGLRGRRRPRWPACAAPFVRAAGRSGAACSHVQSRHGVAARPSGVRGWPSPGARRRRRRPRPPSIRRCAGAGRGRSPPCRRRSSRPARRSAPTPSGGRPRPCPPDRPAPAARSAPARRPVPGVAEIPRASRRRQARRCRSAARRVAASARPRPRPEGHRRAAPPAAPGNRGDSRRRC